MQPTLHVSARPLGCICSCPSGRASTIRRLLRVAVESRRVCREAERNLSLEHFSLRQSRPKSLDKEVQVTTSNFAKDMSDFLLSAHPDPGWLLIEEGIEPAREHEIEFDSCDSQWISRHEGVSRRGRQVLASFDLRRRHLRGGRRP